MGIGVAFLVVVFMAVLAGMMVPMIERTYVGKDFNFVSQSACCCRGFLALCIPLLICFTLSCVTPFHISKLVIQTRLLKAAPMSPISFVSCSNSATKY